MCTGTMVLPRFGNVVEDVVRDGFHDLSRFHGDRGLEHNHHVKKHWVGYRAIFY